MGVLKVKSGGVWVPVGMSMQAGAPVGLVGYASGTAAQTGIPSGSQTDFTGVSVTWVADASRRYKASLTVPSLDQRGANSEQRAGIRNGSNAVLVWDRLATTVNFPYAHHVECIVAGVSGTQTLKGFVQPFGGTLDTVAGFLPTLIVEDITPAAQVGPAAPMQCRVGRATAFSLAHQTVGSIPWDGEEFDGYGMHAPNSTRLVVPVGGRGLWLMGYSVSFAATAQAGTRSTFMWINGNTTHRIAQVETAYNVAGAGNALSASNIIQLNDGDYMETAAFQTSGSANNLGSNADLRQSPTNMWAVRLGALG